MKAVYISWRQLILKADCRLCACKKIECSLLLNLDQYQTNPLLLYDIYKERGHISYINKLLFISSFRRSFQFQERSNSDVTFSCLMLCKRPLFTSFLAFTYTRTKFVFIFETELKSSLRWFAKQESGHWFIQDISFSFLFL